MKGEKKINIGLTTLRIYLSFLVVNSHYFRPKAKTRNKIILKLIYNKIHVPTFYLLSFYFCYKIFKSKNIRKIKIRFQRLLIPYFIWPIIFWSLNNLLSFLFVKFGKLSFKQLILQILTGHVFMTVLWFQYDLIFMTLLTFIIHLLFDEQWIFYILINLKIFAIFFTYSNYNYILFSKYNYNKKYTFGRFFEIIPYCIIGYIFGYFNLIHILSQKRILSINILLPIIILILKYEIFLEIKGFLFQGLKLYVSSISYFFLFSLFPSEKLGNKYIFKLIAFISNHTAGIYFIHKSLNPYLKIFYLIKNKKLTGAIIIYFISFLISIYGKILFKTTKLINLFQ